MHFDSIYAISACDPNGVIGKDGALPWYDRDDLEHFYETTRNQTVIVGYKTYRSLPKDYFLNRTTMVFSRHHRLEIPSSPQLRCVSSLEDFLSLQEVSNRISYVIGGSEIYRLFLDHQLISKVILTEMKHSYVGDTFFPLELIRDWPRQLVRESSTFYIYHYTNPNIEGFSYGH